MRKLTPKQQKFCLKYVECGNATESYKHAYSTSKMLPTTIHRKALELAAVGIISAYIADLQEKIETKVIVNAEYILKRHVEIDAMDITDILNEDWTFKPLAEWPKIWRTSISAIDIQEIRAGQNDPEAAIGYLKRLKWADKLKNLEALGKHVDVQAYMEQVNSKTAVEITEVRRVIVDNKGKLLK